MKAKTKTITPEAQALLRSAASYGPGVLGERRSANASERAQLRDRLESLGLDPPIFLDKEQTWVDRRAKLFEVGEYKDKGVSVTVETLQLLVDTFDLPVPILIEHAKSPLQMGYLTHVQSEGDELFGTLSLTKEANDLVEMSGAHSLSLGLNSALTEIEEVSIVKNPRVPTARLFTGRVFAMETDWKAEYEALQGELSKQFTKRRIEELVAEGRVVPAQVPFANALLESSERVTFDGESVPVPSLLVSLLESGHRHSLFTEHAPAGAGPSHQLPVEEQEFYDRYFSGLSLEDIARNRRQA